jgi:hypothetical protein
MNVENFLKKHFEFREIRRSDGGMYLTRYYLYRKSKWYLPSLYVHCFHSSDFDPELHNHGWNRSVSIILNGSYREERMVKGTVVIRTLKPGMINYIKKGTFHRVDLLSSKVWTLFISGSKMDPNWGFLNIHTLEYTDWKAFEKRKGIT